MTMYPILCLFLLVESLLSSSAPTGLAFNSGIYSATAVTDAVTSGDAIVIQDDPLHETSVAHNWIETLEGDPSATSERVTAFESCTTTFELAIPGPKALKSVEISYVLLDAFGKVKNDNVIFLRFSLDANGQWVESKTISSKIAAWYSMLPKTQKYRLNHVTGFLKKNPGSTPVTFIATGIKQLVSSVISHVEPSGLLSFGLSWVADHDSTLQWGRATKANVSKATQFESSFVAEGRKVWEGIKD
jgi:hypothetical protein